MLAAVAFMLAGCRWLPGRCYRVAACLPYRCRDHASGLPSPLPRPCRASCRRSCRMRHFMWIGQKPCDSVPSYFRKTHRSSDHDCRQRQASGQGPAFADARPTSRPSHPAWKRGSYGSALGVVHYDERGLAVEDVVESAAIARCATNLPRDTAPCARRGRTRLWSRVPSPCTTAPRAVSLGGLVSDPAAAPSPSRPAMTATRRACLPCGSRARRSSLATDPVSEDDSRDSGSTPSRSWLDASFFLYGGGAPIRVTRVTVAGAEGADPASRRSSG
jgi:hypothetical protein